MGNKGETDPVAVSEFSEQMVQDAMLAHERPGCRL